MKLNNQEKIALSKLLLDIMHADGIVTLTETKFYMHLQNRLDISNEHMEKSRHMDLNHCYQAIKDMDIKEKEYIANLMHQMIIADGHVKDEEVKIFNQFCEAAGFPLQSNDIAG